MNKTIPTVLISFMLILIVVIVCGCQYQQNDLIAITAGSDGNLWFTEPNIQKIGKISPTTGDITEYSIHN